MCISTPRFVLPLIASHLASYLHLHVHNLLSFPCHDKLLFNLRRQLDKGWRMNLSLL